MMLFPFMVLWATAAQPASPSFHASKPAPIPAIVTVVHVPTPWYGLPALLRRGFAKAVPTYRAIPGLQTKTFTYARHPRTFGGVYTWETRAAAEAWFAPSWYARVRQRYHAEGKVDYYTVQAVRIDKPFPAEAGGFCVVVAFGKSPVTWPESASLLGVLEVRNTAGQPGTISYWTSKTEAQTLLGSGVSVEYLECPRRIDNRSQPWTASY